jgi:hypothetical protein
MVVVVATVLYADSQERPAARSFEFTYLTKIPALPADAKAAGAIERCAAVTLFQANYKRPTVLRERGRILEIRDARNEI